MEDNNDKQNNIITEQIKGKAKGGVKKVAGKILKMLLPVVPIIIIALIFYTVVSLVVDFFVGIFESILNFFNFDRENGAYEIKDEEVDEVLKQLKEQYDLTAEDLGLLGDIDYETATEEELAEAERKYIKLFLEAQQTTQNINTEVRGSNGSVYMRTPVTSELTVGDYTVMQQVGDLQSMIFMTQERFRETVEAGGEFDDLRRYYSIDDNGNLLLINFNYVNGASDLTIQSVDYKSMISQYTTPALFFVDMAMSVQNPNFMERFVEMVKDSNITLNVVYNTTVHSTRRYWQEYEINEEGEPELVQKSSEDIEISYNPTVIVTEAKTWVFSKESGINQNIDGPRSLPHNQTGSGISAILTFEEMATVTYTESTPKEEYNGGEKGEDGTFVGLLDERFRIPHSANRRSAGPDLVSNSAAFLEFLGRSTTTQPLEEIMRYVLYKYTGRSYGVTNFEDLLKYMSPQLTVMGSDYSVNTGFIKDVDTLISAINQVYGGEVRTNFLAEAEHFMEMQERYNVDATFAIAVAFIESTGGTNWGAIAEHTHNWMSVSGSYNGQSYQTPNSSRTWRVYASYEEAIMDFGDLIANGSYYYKAGRYTVKEIAPTYCNAQWGEDVVAEMTKLLTAAGITADSGDANAVQLKIAEIAQNSAAYGIVARSGYCLGWVNDVYEAAGASVQRKDCARCSGNAFSVSKDFTNIPIGAAIYQYSSTTAGLQYGHVGIYVGNGMVCHNIGYVKTETLQSFLSGHKESCWGWTSSTPVNASYPVNPGLIQAGHAIMHPIP